MTEKAKRRLSNFNFMNDGAHIALVHKDQGGPANEVTTLIYKSVNDVTDVLLEKASKVQVTLEFEDFLMKFFHMYYEDAMVLAKVLGYAKEEEKTKDKDPYKDYIDEKVKNIKIMKSLHEAEDVAKAISSLSAGDFVEVLEAQGLLEKAILSIEKDANAGVLPEVLKSKEETTLQEEIQKAVAKAEEVLKAKIADQEVELQKARDEIAAYKKEKEEIVAKARKEKLTAVVSKDEVEDLYKSTKELSDEAFEVITKSLGNKQKAQDESDLFKEKGVGGEGKADDQSKLNRVAEIIKAKKKTK